MAKTDIGRAVPLLKGEYNPATTYELNDIVSLNGSLYWHYSHEETTNVAPQATSTWKVVLSLADAEAYIARAETAAGEAEDAKDAALAAQTAAETASTTATGASATATAAKNDAVTAKTAAETAQAGAVSAKNDAVTAKEAAQTAASSAGTSATNANNSAGTAQYYAESAGTSASTATTKASEASASASTASTAATTATTKASEASTSATTATTKAGEASTSATSAASSAAAAQAVKDSIPEDYSQLSEDVSDLKTQISNHEKISHDLKNLFTGWKQGYYSGSTGAYEPNHNNYVCTIEAIPLEADTEILYTANINDFINIPTLYVNFYNSDMTYIKSNQVTIDGIKIVGVSTDPALVGKSLKINFSFSVGSPPASVTPAEMPAMMIYKNTDGKTFDLIGNTFSNNNDEIYKFTNKVFFNISGNIWQRSANRIGLNKTLCFENDCIITIDNGYKFSIFKFASNEISYNNVVEIVEWRTEQYIVKAGTYFIVNIANTNDSAIMPDESYVIHFNTERSIIEKKTIVFHKSTINADGTETMTGNSATTEIIDSPTELIISGNARAVLALYNGIEYIGKVNANNRIDKVSGNWKFFTDGVVDVRKYLAVSGATKARMCVLPLSGSSESIDDDSEAQTFGEANLQIIGYKFATIEFVNGNYHKKGEVVTVKNDYYLDSGFNKTGVMLEKIGELKYLQAFCKYNDKYYSTNGTYISIQDSDFVEINNQQINLGHGNSLQLGNNGKAYASGWDDNKIYVVDLATLTVESTISIPKTVSGTEYTTGVVDDVRQLAYIFQRSTYPDTDDYYNFIIYDIANETIISTKKITVPFAAMQACDLYHDRIIVLNGMGNNNGFRVYNLEGDIVGDYILNTFTTEPEGVCIDRNTHELLVSNVGRNLYVIRPIV